MNLPRLVLVGALVLSGCAAPTSVTQTWHAPVTAETPPMKRILVFGARMDQAHRRGIEDGFVAALAREGIVARPSYELFEGPPPKKEEARAIIAQQGFDGVLVAAVQSVRNETRWDTMGPSYWSYGWYGWGSRSYVVTDQVVRCETSLWEARNGGEKMVWAAASKTLNAEDGNDFVASVTSAVVPELTRARFLVPTGLPRVEPPRRTCSRWTRRAFARGTDHCGAMKIPFHVLM